MAERENRNVALIGTSFMGRAHSNAYLKVGKFFDLPNIPVMHTSVGQYPEEVEPFAANWGWKHTSTDWKQAVAGDEIDLVDICTPNNLHAPMAVRAIESGKHVACEKPLADTLDNARRMRDAAADARGKSFVWFSYRGCPAVALARRMVREGKIGRIYHVRAQYLQDFGGPDTPLIWRFTSEVAGSGAHGDLNAHIVDAARFITGEQITEVCGAIEETFIKQRTTPDAASSGSDEKGDVTVDDAVMFLARLSGGGVANFEATRLAMGDRNANRIEINGERGSLQWDLENMNVLWYYNEEDDGARQGWQRILCTNPEHHPYMHAWWPDGHLLGYEHAAVNLASCMFNAIEGKEMEVPMADFEDAYQVQRVLEAALRSARERSWVKLEDVG